MFNILKSLSTSSKSEDESSHVVDKTRPTVRRASSTRVLPPEPPASRHLSRRQSLDSGGINAIEDENVSAEITRADLKEMRKLRKVATKLKVTQETAQSPNSSKENLTQRTFVFRTHAEEKELYHKTQQLMDEAIAQVAEAWLEQQFSVAVELLVPEQRDTFRVEQERKMNRLSTRLSMTFVADSEELLAHRCESFLLERGKQVSPSPDEAPAEEVAPLMKIDMAVYSNSQGVVQRALGMGGAKVNPLLASRVSKNSKTETLAK